MSSIVEGYRVVKAKEDISSGLNHEDDGFVPREKPPTPPFKPRDSVIKKDAPWTPETSPEDKAWYELIGSLGQRVKDHNKDTHEITVYTGGASAIKVQVVGYADPEAVNAAKAQEDAIENLNCVAFVSDN